MPTLKSSRIRRGASGVIDVLPGLIWTAKPGGAVDFVNQRWRDFTGLGIEESKGDGWRAAIHREDLPQFLDRWQAVQASDRPGELEARLMRNDGSSRRFLFRCSPMIDAAGKVFKWCGMTIDIEDLKRAEKALRESENELRDLIRRVPASISVANAKGELVYSSTRGLAYSGNKLENIIGHGFIRTIHPDEQEMVRTEWMRCVAAGEPMELDHRIRRADGVYRWFHVRVEPFFDEHGKVLRWYGLLTDIDDQRKAEEALRQSEQRLSTAMQIATVAQLSASIAHEISQPILGIITNASTCLKMLTSEPANVEGARETARRSIRDGNRASEVIARLRALFGKDQARTDTFDLNDAAREVIAFSSVDLLRKGVMQRSELADDLPPIIGDRVQLQQVILNLVLNAADAMRGIRDRPRLMVIRTALDPANGVRLSVQDTGTGIDPERVERLFEAFYTTKSSGMGIGLSVSRSIIENHQGRLWAAPNEGPGATFSFTVPRRKRGLRQKAAP